MAIKALVFDMGGVLVKTVNKKHRTELAHAHSLTYSELEKLVYGSESAQSASRGDITETEHFLAVLSRLGLQPTEFSRFREEFWGGDDIDKDLVAFIRTQKENYKIAMLSNAMSETRAWLDEKYQLLDLFDLVYFSAEQRMAKPDHRYYLRLLDELQVEPEEVVFIDDFLENIQAAKELGMNAVHYQSTSQAIADIKGFL